MKERIKILSRKSQNNTTTVNKIVNTKCYYKYIKSIPKERVYSNNGKQHSLQPNKINCTLIKITGKFYQEIFAYGSLRQKLKYTNILQSSILTILYIDSNKKNFEMNIFEGEFTLLYVKYSACTSFTCYSWTICLCSYSLLLLELHVFTQLATYAGIVFCGNTLSNTGSLLNSKSTPLLVMVALLINTSTGPV